MKKSLKIYIALLLFVFILFPTINTSAIDMNLNSFENTLNTSAANNLITDQILQNETTNNESSAPTVTTSSSDDEFLTIENILSITIIVIGIILIFLAIAILIRCK